MKILRKLTKLDLKLNKKRTIGTLIGIILATALIVVVGGMFEVFRNTLVQSTIKYEGYYHLELLNIDKNDLATVKENKSFSRVMEVGFVGTVFDEEGYASNTVLSMDEYVYSELKRTVDEGRFPKNNTEILIDDSYKRMYNINIGDTVKVATDITITDEGLNISNENLKEYKVVGVTSSYGTLITTYEDTDIYMAFLTLKNPKNHKKDISKLLGVDDYTKDRSAKYLYSTNRDLLRWEVFSFGEETTKFLVAVLAIVIGIILFTSVFSIRNSFAISTNEKIRLYGMLASTGATKKQIRRMVLFEGLVLGLIGIIGGILLGVFVVWLLTIIINQLAINANLSDGGMLYYKFTIVPIILSIIVSIVMIYLSTISSSIKAGRVSPIQNIRNSDNIKAKKLKVPFIIRKMFKTGGVLAYKNLKRSKKKYRVTVVSLTISIFIFITVSSFLEYGLKEIKNEFGGINYDVMVNFNGPQENVNLKDYTSLGKAYILYVNYSDGQYELRDTSHVKNELTLGSGCTDVDENYNCINNEKIVNMREYYYDDDTFKEICKKIGAKYDDVKDKIIIADYVTEKKKIIRTTDYKKNDKITLTNSYTNDSYTYNVGAITDFYPWGSENSSRYDLHIIANEKYYKGKNKLMLDSIYYKTNNANKLTEELNKIDGEYNVENISELAKQINTIILIFSIFIYGFIIVVTLIGVTSVFNTINSNMELRKREFATLKSIGMTKKEFNRMILLESIFYSAKSLFYGIILGLIGSYLVYTAFMSKMDFGYLFPKVPIIISIVFIIVLVYTIMKYSLDKTRKQNIIETIRKENI